MHILNEGFLPYLVRSPCRPVQHDPRALLARLWAIIRTPYADCAPSIPTPYAHRAPSLRTPYALLKRIAPNRPPGAVRAT